MSIDPCYAPSVSGPSEKLERLGHLLDKLTSVVVCYSGGIDSLLLLAVAHQRLGKRAIGLTAISPSLPERERADAVRFASSLGVRHELVTSNEIDHPDYVKNAPDRCFHCKTELYTLARDKMTEWNAHYVINGTNTDDLGDYRPGQSAAEQFGVRSPFLEIGMSKVDVRAAAKLMGISDWNKPAAACLASRLPYGTAVTRERLARVERVEAYLLEHDFSQVRVRYHDNVARIEVHHSEMPRLIAPVMAKAVTAIAQAQGFDFVTLDLTGYRTGSLNESLPNRSLPIVS